MSYVLKQNNIELVKTLNWSPRTYGKITGTSYPVEVSLDYVWEHEGYWLGWEADIEVQHIPTIEEQINAIHNALQDSIDTKAIALGFSSGNALMLYAGFTNPFQNIAQTFASWEASVWFEAESYKQSVIAGTAPMLNAEQAIAMMPPYVG